MNIVTVHLQKHRGKSILLDTNLWLLLLIGSYDENKISEFKRTYIFTKNDFSLLINFLRNFNLVVTPNILTEVANLTEGFNTHTNYKLFSFFKEMIEPIPEVYIPSVDVLKTSFIKFGLSDSVIHKISSSGVFILTEDLKLYGYLVSNGLDVINFNHIRSDYILKK